jgi:hypothetical protein
MDAYCDESQRRPTETIPIWLPCGRQLLQGGRHLLVILGIKCTEMALHTSLRERRQFVQTDNGWGQESGLSPTH